MTVPVDERVQPHQLARLGALPRAERGGADGGPERAVVERVAAAAEPVVDDAMGGDQTELAGREHAGELAQCTVDERAAAAGAPSDVEHLRHDIPPDSSTARLRRESRATMSRAAMRSSSLMPSASSTTT